MLTALAAAGGAAVVQAVGSDEWEELRSRLAWWLGRGNAEHEREELERLDRSAAELAAAAMADHVRGRQEAAWQTRIETVLESLADEEQRYEAAVQLRRLLEEVARSASGRGGGVACNATYFPGPIQTGIAKRQDLSLGSIGHTPPGPENDPDDDWPQET